MTPQELRREREQYARDVLEQYCRTPGTLGHVRPADRALARYLYDRNIPLPLVEDAFVLATARRTFRPAGAVPLSPVRSLHFYLPLVQELLLHRPDLGYVRALRSRLQRVFGANTFQPR